MWAGRSEEVRLRGPGCDRGTLVAPVAGAPSSLVAALLRLWRGRDQLAGEDEGPQTGALRLLLAAYAVGLQQPGAL
jgi:hypothetical protein